MNKRSTLPEKMDDPQVSFKEVNLALRELEIVNKMLGGYNVILDSLEQINLGREKIKILDIGSGGGDILRKISEWANTKNIEVDLTGIDHNPNMTDYAAKKSGNHFNISYKTIDVWSEEIKKENPHIVINNLFCHHFDDEELVKLVKRMNALSSDHTIINDLHRHPFAYYSIKCITAVFSRSNLVKYDAPLSVARALTKEEWISILEKAGIKNYKIKWMWAWRWQIIISKHAG